jgi:hypothetical protein
MLLLSPPFCVLSWRSKGYRLYVAFGLAFSLLEVSLTTKTSVPCITLIAFLRTGMDCNFVFSSYIITNLHDQMLDAFIIYPQLPIPYTFTAMPPPVSLTYSNLPSFLKIPSNFQSPTATSVSGNALLSAVTILDSNPLSAFPTAALTAIAAPSDAFPFPTSPTSDPSASQSTAPCPRIIATFVRPTPPPLNVPTARVFSLYLRFLRVSFPCR